MAITCPVGLDVAKLRDEVISMYDLVARDPAGEYHFHRGPEFAAERLGYDREVLARLPPETTASFAGVANPHAVGPLRAGETVLDIGSGAGTDLLLAAIATGPTGRAIGVDITESMRARARASADALELRNVEVRAGDAMSLPLEDGSVDVVISNGVLNLVPNKEIAFKEIARVLRKGGRLQLGDIVVGRELSEKIRSDIDLWTGWIAGALPEAELVSLLGEVGFADVRITHRYDPFRGTSKENTARKFAVIGVNVHGTSK